MSFAHPLALWGLLLVPLVAVALALDGQRRRRALQHVGHLPQILKMTASVSVARRRAKGVLLVLAMALLVIAVARPQRPGAARLLPQRGLDLVVALDFSRSNRLRAIFNASLCGLCIGLSVLGGRLHIVMMQAIVVVTAAAYFGWRPPVGAPAPGPVQRRRDRRIVPDGVAGRGGQAERGCAESNRSQVDYAGTSPTAGQVSPTPGPARILRSRHRPDPRGRRLRGTRGRVA